MDGAAAGKHKIIEKTAEFLDVPESVLRRIPNMQIVCGREIYIDNHRGIMEYTPEEISVNGVETVITIRGTELEIRAINETEISVRGRITAIEFS